ncbi:MAG TPA: hypothetical protein VJH65_00110 [Candidatus Nanoarchaeia archaeon]|nr:hypothetical protein [Candidatus Nanoarchaeia archaeon]
MKKRLFIFTFILLLFLTLPLMSADIIINQQPKESYNMGEIIEAPMKIVTLTGINNFFSMKMICNGIETEVYKEFVGIKGGEEKVINPSIPLTNSLIGISAGVCKIKAALGEEFVLTNEFKISDKIEIKILSEEKTFAPEQDISIKGEATKQNGELVNGIIDLKITGENSEEKIAISDSVKNGYFYLNFSLPKETKAGEYIASINIYEKDFNGIITNKGIINDVITITPVPTSLEISLEEKEVEPGSSVKIKIILHDQTGEKIDSIGFVSIKNSKNTVIDQQEAGTDQVIEHPIKYNEPPSEWNIFATSNKLTAETKFRIKEKQDINIEIINKTIMVTNIGNVPYNQIATVKIANETEIINITLDIDESKKYLLTAPDGEYKIEVLTQEGESITGMAVLIGKAIDIKEASEGVMRIIRHPISWLFILLVLGLMAYLVFKKGYKRAFFGYITRRKKENPAKVLPLDNISSIKSKSVAELSLSIKGDKQDASIVCINIKNLKETKKKGNVQETLQKISDIAVRNKAAIYENNDSLFFILAPITTRTFKNEITALEIAQHAKDILKEHNRLFNQKIEFGISLNEGSIIVKKDPEALKFMSMGTTVTTAKRIASLYNEEILLSEIIKNKLGSKIRAEKLENDKSINIYKLIQVKEQSEENKKFINSFLKRIDDKPGRR